MRPHVRYSAFLFAIGLVLVTYAWPLAARQQPTLQQPVPQTSPVVVVPGNPAVVNNPEVPSQLAVSVTEAKSPAAPAHYQDQAIWALMVSFMIQWLKKQKWFGWVTEQTSARIKTQFGFIAALVTAAGIHFAVSGSVLDSGGAAITVSGLSLNVLKDIIWQWASQQAWYRLVVKEPREVVIAHSGSGIGGTV